MIQFRRDIKTLLLAQIQICLNISKLLQENEHIGCTFIAISMKLGATWHVSLYYSPHHNGVYCSGFTGHRNREFSDLFGGTSVLHLFTGERALPVPAVRGEPLACTHAPSRSLPAELGEHHAFPFTFERTHEMACQTQYKALSHYFLLWPLNHFETGNIHLLLKWVSLRA